MKPRKIRIYVDPDIEGADLSLLTSDLKQQFKETEYEIVSDEGVAHVGIFNCQEETVLPGGLAVISIYCENTHPHKIWRHTSEQIMHILRISFLAILRHEAVA